jgi:hypothetical protein
MGRIITLFEHECTIGFGWTNRDLVALERFSRTAGADMLRPVVRGGERELRAAHHVGVFRLGNRTRDEGWASFLSSSCADSETYRQRSSQRFSGWWVVGTLSGDAANDGARVVHPARLRYSVSWENQAFRPLPFGRSVAVFAS